MDDSRLVHRKFGGSKPLLPLILEFDFDLDLKIIVTRCVYWCRRAESNRGPTDYESVALPTELRRRAGADSNRIMHP